jgi:hypothetical protein
MRQKQLMILLGGLVVLLVLALLTGVFDDDEFTTVEVPDVSIPTDEIDRVRLGLPADRVVLERGSGTWQLTEPTPAPADSAAVARLLEGLAAMELESVVSNNPGRYARYGVDSTGKTITADWGGEEHRLVVGNAGPDFQSVYVRLDDDPRVFLTRTRLEVPDAPDRWRDRVALRLPVQQVTRATVTLNEQPFAVRYDGEWTLERAGSTAPADSNRVIQWLRRFGTLSADGFLDDVTPQEVQDHATHRIDFIASGNLEVGTIWFQEREADVAFTRGDVTYKFNAPTRLPTYFPDPETLLPVR